MIAVVVIAACGQAKAEPAATHSGLTAPAGWQALPQLAEAISSAARETKIAVDGVDAWGETAMGCYATWLAMSGGDAAPDALADQVVAGLGAAKLSVSDVVKPSSSGGTLSLRFERTPHRGRLRAELVKGRITAVACFSNAREPVACESACTTWIGAMK
jgi:hypothetical protein